ELETPPPSPLPLVAPAGTARPRRRHRPWSAGNRRPPGPGIASPARVRAFRARPVSPGLPAGAVTLAPSNRLGPPGAAATELELGLFGPQDHRAPGRLTDRGTAELGASLSHPMLQPGRHERHGALRRQRVDPELAGPPAWRVTSRTASSLVPRWPQAGQ